MADKSQPKSADAPVGVYDSGRAKREVARPVFEPSISSRIGSAASGIASKARGVVSETKRAAKSFGDSFRKPTRGRR